MAERLEFTPRKDAGKPRFDMVGESYGRLTVTAFVSMKGKTAYWLTQCVCGNHKVCVRGDLKGGKIRSCGCLRKEVMHLTKSTHGLSKSPEYNIWLGMIARCHRKTEKVYDRYGGRGIFVCPEWRQDFMAFISDMGFRPSPDLSLERLDNNRGYYKENCKWATITEQNRNKRNNVILAFNDEVLLLEEWAVRLGTSPRTISSRLNRGWTVEEALGTKPNEKRRKWSTDSNSQNV